MASKRSIQIAAATCLTVLGLCAVASARTITVNNAGTAEFDNIQAAIDTAVDGDTVIIEPGTYTGQGNRDVDFRGKAITVRSLHPHDPEVVAATVLDGGDAWSRGFVFTSKEGTASQLSGLTIRNGRNEQGAGIYCGDGSPTISYCVVRENAAARGAGLYCGYGGSPVLIGCVFRRNEASERGGALYNSTTSCPTLVNCVLNGNSALYEGGGVYCGLRSRPTVVNCTLSNNRVRDLGGGVSGDSTLVFVNSILWGNSAHGVRDERAQIYGGTPDVSYCCVEGWTGELGGDGNVGSSPLFVDALGADGIAGTADDDLRLLAGSPCVDAGRNESLPAATNVDLDGNPRIVNGVVDMGAQEGARQGFIFGAESLEVPEQGVALLTVWLASRPDGALEVRVRRESGDSDITIQSGEILYFDPTNYSVPQAIEVAAAEDADFLPGRATIHLACPGWADATVRVQEVDNDVPSMIYVDADAPGANDGATWADAFTDLERALSIAAEAGVEEVRVAGGRYVPTDATWRDEASFNLVAGLTLRGGYAGYGAADPDSRDTHLHASVLSGLRQRYHVVTARWLDRPTLLEGFSIEQGRAWRGPEYHGGGVYAYASHLHVLDCRFANNYAFRGAAIGGRASMLTVTGCTFEGNYAKSRGAALYCHEGEVAVQDCISFSNVSEYEGGGMYADSVERLVVEGCVFGRNHAGRGGGGLYATGCRTCIVTDCLFASNSANGAAGGLCGRGVSRGDEMVIRRCRFLGNHAAVGGIGGGGGGVLVGGFEIAVITNCLFSGNHASVGGGFYTACEHVNLANCTFSKNAAIEAGGGIYGSDGGIYTEGGDLTLANCILWGNVDGQSEAEPAQLSLGGAVIANHCCIQGWTGSLGGSGNLDENPRFVDLLGPDNRAGTSDDNLRLLAVSPCLDAGDNQALPEPMPEDLDRHARIGGGRIDMGAYEGPHQGFVIEERSFVIAENQDAQLTLALAMDPGREVEVRIVAETGEGGPLSTVPEVLRFNSSNFSIPQTVTLSAVADEDYRHADLLVHVDMSDQAPLGIEVRVIDDDVPEIVFVDALASGANDGTDWANSFVHFKEALAVAQSHPEIKEIRVAQGAYETAYSGTDRQWCFALQSGLAIRGGYGGVSEVDPNARDLRAYPTILDGGLTDPSQVAGTRDRRSVVAADAVDETAILDGFVIKGGAYGIYAVNSRAIIANCVVIENLGYAGILCLGGWPKIIGCTVAGNGGNGIACGDGEIINCTIADNSDWGISCGIALITNSVVWGNGFIPTESDEARGVQPIGQIDGACPVVTYCNVQAGWPGKGNIDTPPSFLDTVARDYHLALDSPCLNAGDPEYVLPEGLVDIDGESRVADGRVDMGSDESAAVGPLLALTPNEIRFLVCAGDPNVPRRTVTVRNNGVGLLHWTIPDACSWLHVSPAEGASAGDGADVTLTIEVSDLAPGTYQCELPVEAPGALNAAQAVSIQLDIGTELHVPGQHPTIQEAVDSALDGSVIVVAGGHYSGAGNQSIDFGGKAITVRSETGPAQCIIACEFPDRTYGVGFSFHSGETSESVLDGFTITGASCGIVCTEASSPTIRNCHIVGNTPGRDSRDLGGGVLCQDRSNPLIAGCLIMDNGSPDGGGLCSSKSSPTVRDCLFIRNVAYGCPGCQRIVPGSGGAIFCVEGGAAVERCVMSENQADLGAGFYCERSRPTLTNCLITGNHDLGRWADDEFGEGGAGVCSWAARPIISNCTIVGNAHVAGVGGGVSSLYEGVVSIRDSILWGNVAAEGDQVAVPVLEDNHQDVGSALIARSSSIQGGSSGVYVGPSSCLDWQFDNIESDPLFAVPGYWDSNGTPDDGDDDFWVDGDYHLQSQAGRWDPVGARWVIDGVTSPCIDAGDPNRPVGEEPEPNRGRINMGAYGGSAEASKSP